MSPIESILDKVLHELTAPSFLAALNYRTSFAIVSPMESQAHFYERAKSWRPS